MPIKAMPIKNIAIVTGQRMLNVLICKGDFHWLFLLLITNKIQIILIFIKE